MIWALLIFIPTLFFVPHYTYLFLGLKSLPWEINFKKLEFPLFLIILIIFLSGINQIINYSTNVDISKSTSDIIPYSIFILISYFTAKKIDNKVIILLLIFISFEILVGLIEYFLGTRTLFNFQNNTLSPFGMRGLLYYKRVYGLSTNSSVLAMKTFAGLLLLYFCNIKGKKFYVFLVIFFIGIVITFTRAILLGVMIFFAMHYYKQTVTFINRTLKKKRVKFIVFLTLIALFVLLIVALFNIDVLYKQINRGLATADASGRGKIFAFYLDFIKNHFFLGNGSYKLWFKDGDMIYHAHNSYLQTFATNGFFIFLLYFVLIFQKNALRNYKYTIPILLLSFFQYGILWGISFLDIVYYVFLLRLPSDFSHDETITAR